ERALGRLGKSKRVRDSEVRARALRAQIALQMADKSGPWADFHWLAVSAPLRAEADATAQALEHAGGVQRLSKAERMDRASALAVAGSAGRARQHWLRACVAAISQDRVGRTSAVPVRAFALQRWTIRKSALALRRLLGALW